MIRLRTGLFFLLSVLCLTAVSHATELTLAPTDRILILLPHPDDETLCCGGLIETAVQKHLPIQLVYLTYGDNNAWAFTLYHHFPVFRPKKMRAMGEIRRQEALAAAGVLGVPSDQLIFLGYPDFGTLAIWKDHWGNAAAYESRMTCVREVPYSTAYRPGAAYKGEEIQEDLQSVITNFRPTKLFVPHPQDLQTDHQALYLFTHVALKTLAKKVTPEIYAYVTHAPAWPPHRGLHKDQTLDPPPTFKDPTLWLRLSLTPDQVDKKLEALKKHRTQWAYSRRSMLSYVRSNELFLDLTPEECRQGPATSEVTNATKTSIND